MHGILQYAWDNRLWLALAAGLAAALLTALLLVLGSTGRAPFVYSLF